jgi:Flp pilus assembly protein TadG
MPSFRRPSRRPGVIAPMTAIFSVFLLGMVAFAVDISYIVLSQSELQNAADSAALAGAQQLMTNFTTYSLPNQTVATQTLLIASAMTSAKASAITYAAANAAGSVSSLTLLASDIDIGYTDASGKYTTYAVGNAYPNTVKVMIRRDSTANQPLSLFFAPVLGTNSITLSASAASTLYTGTVNSFKTGSSTNVFMLPMTYDVNYWTNFAATGKDPDGNLTLAANGSAELQIYPSSIAAPGNFGELSLNDSHNGASTTASWVSGGVSSTDIQSLVSANLLPLSSHSATAWDWQGNPGFKASNVMDVNAQVGKTFWLPLFKPYTTSPYLGATGQGSNTFYNIVAFVPVQIMPATSSNGQIVVQPATMVDGNAVFSPSTITPAGTASSSSSSTATLMAPKLSH